MEKEILNVIRYFDQFDYSPTVSEIFSFISRKTSLDLLNKRLEILHVKKKLIKGHSATKYPRFVLYHRRKLLAVQKRKEIISKKKIKKINLYFKLLSLFPQIKLIGLSGSMAMMSASLKDDIDLFIITARNRLFTGRFIAVTLAKILKIDRQRGSVTQLNSFKDRICLNLFFDEKNLKVPIFKMTPYIGHEILQMKPLIVKGNVYERFLKANRWVFKIFPNARENLESRIQNSELKNKILNSKSIHNSKFIILNFGWILELILKNIQLASINRHKTFEIVTDTQLWFFPDDFEKKLDY